MWLDDSNQLLLGLWLSSADVEMGAGAETFCGRNTQGCSLLLSIMRGQRIDSLQPDTSLSGRAQLGRALKTQVEAREPRQDCDQGYKQGA